jgi:hypothetical protein
MVEFVKIFADTVLHCHTMMMMKQGIDHLRMELIEGKLALVESLCLGVPGILYVSKDLEKLFLQEVEARGGAFDDVSYSQHTHTGRFVVELKVQDLRLQISVVRVTVCPSTKVEALMHSGVISLMKADEVAKVEMVWDFAEKRLIEVHNTSEFVNSEFFNAHGDKVNIDSCGVLKLNIYLE